MQFRTIIGWFCILAGAIFLSINSLILYRGAYRFGHDEIDRVAFGIAAAVVPWVIAIMPALVTETWRPMWGGLRRPSASTCAVILTWGAFIAYNLTNGAGVIATSRLETVADREQSADKTTALKSQRETLRGQLDATPQHRPPETIERLIAAEQTNRLWDRTERCTDATARTSREFCDGVRKLEAELASGKSATDLFRRIQGLDAQISNAGPVIASSDPQADMLHDLTGLTRKQIQIWLPASTPVILEIGAGLMWHFGFSVLGIGLSAPRNAIVRQSVPEPVFNSAPLMSPERARATPVVPLETLTAQRKLCEWFFAHCSRPVASGALGEDEWYEHYTAICRRSFDAPLPLDSFRRIASRYVPRIQQIEGVTYYHEVLPLIPEDAA